MKFNKSYLLLLIPLAAGWYLLRGSPQAPSAAPQAPQKGIQMMSRATVDKSEALPKVQQLAQKRELYQAESAIRMMTLNATKKNGHFQFKLNYQPLRRDCKNGDIDLIKSAVGPAQTLIFTLEDEQGNAVIKPRKVTIAELMTAFTSAISVPSSARAQYYQLMLCTADFKESCHGKAAFDFFAMEEATQENKPMPPRSNYVFFTQTLRVDAESVKVFDSREHGKKEQLQKYLKVADGGTDRSSFLENFMQSNSKIKPLPAIIKDQTMTINLYYRDNKGCFK